MRSYVARPVFSLVGRKEVAGRIGSKVTTSIRVERRLPFFSSRVLRVLTNVLFVVIAVAFLLRPARRKVEDT